MTKQPEGWEEKLISIIGNYGIFSKSASILYEEIHIAVGGTPEDMLFGNLKFFISQEIKRAERNGIKLCEEVVKEALQDKEMAKNPDDPEIRAIYLLKELELLSKSIKEEWMITTLSAPPPLNSIYKVARNRLYKTSEAKAWQEKAAWEFKRTSKGEKFEGKVAVFINIYPHDNRRRDIDGGQKLLLDAIEDSGVIKNDYQVAVLHIERHQPDGSGRVEVLVREKI